jgi:hypothetical protein
MIAMSLEEDDVKWPVSGTSILELEDQSKIRATLILEVGEGTTDALTSSSSRLMAIMTSI